jgi:diketogulonate reductase-like aldo/keto reductase
MDLTLKSGVTIPRLGLGVYQSRPGAETENAVRAALEIGYRHVDTARVYGNERDVGRAIKSVDRKDVFVTTKLWSSDHARAEQAFEESLRDLGCEYVDLYLIHWPVERARVQAWRGLESLKKRGLVRAIGVSNYLERHLAEMDSVPDVNQVELSCFLQQRPLAAYCQERGIAVEAYSPLTQGKKLGDPTLASVAKKHDATPAQVLVKWALDKGHVVLPKSVKRARIEENFRAQHLALDAEDTRRLDALDSRFRTCWDPTDVP